MAVEEADARTRLAASNQSPPPIRHFNMPYTRSTGPVADPPPITCREKAQTSVILRRWRCRWGAPSALFKRLRPQRRRSVPERRPSDFASLRFCALVS
eukprot:scaffold139_cov246-Pinguiococcus_pyrenoidosus.AAC.8